MSELHERVAAGLRRMRTLCDALLFVEDATEWLCVEAILFGYPVFRACRLENMHANGDSVPCPFVPLWREYNDVCADDVKRFCDGFSEWTP